MITPDSGVAARLEAARQDLLDLGMRNPLLNYRPLRARGLEVVAELASEVFHTLVRDGKIMTFEPLPPSGAVPMPDEQPEGSSGTRAIRPNDLKLQTQLPTDQLQGRLLATHYAARTHIEERGANILYLALGKLHWFEATHSQERRQAPLLLIPVALERTSVGSKFQMTFTGDDIEANLSLAAKLVREFGIVLPVLPDSEDLEVGTYLGQIAQEVQEQPRWVVDRNSIVLGFFSFGKFMMYRDLDAETWPKDRAPGAHPVLKALLAEGFREPRPTVGDDDQVDEHVTPAESTHVVDADSSQTVALLAASGGSNLVIQGPPGTGKSQTITNMIADAVYRGKTVLFVAEKMAALEVVKRRLDAIGMGAACLELHSQKAHKTTVIKELAATLQVGRPLVAERAHDLTTLSTLRARLNSYSEEHNMPVGQTGVTPHHAVGELVRLKVEAMEGAPPRLTIPAIAAWTGEDYWRAEALVKDLQHLLASVPVARDHPFWTTRRTRLLPTEQAHVQDALQEALRTTTELREAATRLADLMGVAPAPTTRAEAERLFTAAQRVVDAPDLRGVRLGQETWRERQEETRELLKAGNRFAELHKQYGEELQPEAWDKILLKRKKYCVNTAKSGGDCSPAPIGKNGVTRPRSIKPHHLALWQRCAIW